MRNDFNDNEIAWIKRKNKKTGRAEEHPFPVVGGRLRLFHEDVEKFDSIAANVAAGIETEIVKYEDDVAVVKARASVNGNAWTGIGMASKSRDRLIYPAILELAETRAIARALRFAGYGVEYTGAEEVPLDISTGKNDDPEPTREKSPEGPTEEPARDVEAESAKAAVWDKLKSEYCDVPLGDLQQFAGDFMKGALEKYPEGTTMDGLMKIALDRWPEFSRAFHGAIKSSGLLGPEDDGPKGSGQDRTRPDKAKKEAYEKKREEVSESKRPEPDEKPKSASEQKLKARLFMKLPDGINVKALNSFMGSFVENNPGTTISDVCEAGLEEPEKFVELLTKHCLAAGIEPGYDYDKPKEDKVVSNKKAYSDFRREWVNLTWDRFTKYILKNTSRFQSDRDEYDAAVAKYEKLAKKRGEKAPFPFRFSYEGDVSTDAEIVLDPEQSIIKEEAKSDELKLVEKFRRSYPKMAKKTDEATGLHSPHNGDDCEKWLDEFEHQMTTWEIKNKKTYSE